MWHSTGNGLVARSFKTNGCFRNPKAITVRSKKTALKWIFNQLLGHALFRPIEIKFQIVPPRSSVQVHIQFVSPPVCKNFTKTCRLPGSFQQRRPDGTDAWMLACFSRWVCGLTLKSQPQGKLGLKNDLKARLSSSVWISAHKILEKHSSFEEGKASAESVFSGLYRAGTV